MTRPEGTDFRIFVDGIEVGAGKASPEDARKLEGSMSVALRYRPNWPGVWHAMALAADTTDSDDDI